MLDKLGGAFAPKPSSGPHKSRKCLPLILILQNAVGMQVYAPTYREVVAILDAGHILVDGKPLFSPKLQETEPFFSSTKHITKTLTSPKILLEPISVARGGGGGLNVSVLCPKPPIA
ncbi:hypothetical protein IFM89_030720 [Coptis chinensis]|uniref:Small ribosomal subunit protein eS4 N-terminal domain-containing protein n=1 Tax=Coptis chinensis TaxID=261450 RepID=A0A835J0K7_9MAGN|nr:hypothetical protein IFM89_030720 [Coptis chinensis]